VRRGIEIRLAGAEADHVLPLGFELGRAGGYGQRGGGFDALDAAGYGHSHLNFLWFASIHNAQLY
jgi:hypothetical protein